MNAIKTAADHFDAILSATGVLAFALFVLGASVVTIAKPVLAVPARAPVRQERGAVR